MEIAITAIGTANPPYKRQQLETAELIAASLCLAPAEKRLLKSVYKATGIEYRHSVLSDYCSEPGQFTFFPNDPTADFPTVAARMKIYKANALKLALAAIEDCLSSLKEFKKNDITHLITVSCTGMYAPGIDIEIVEQLKLNSSVKRTVINFMGCYGVFNGIKVAEAICKAEPKANVLLVSVELCTLHFQKSMKMDHVISNAIFADGAAAALIQPSLYGEKAFNLTAFYCDLLPQTKQEMAWEIGDNGFDIILSAYVPEVIRTGIPVFLQNLLNQKGFHPSDIDFYAIHPGGIKILQGCEQSLGLTMEQNKYSYEVLKNYGNMSSATILFVLKAIWNAVQPEDHHRTIFSCAFGPGLTFESMLLQIQ